MVGGRLMGFDIRRDALAHSDECSRCILRRRNEDTLIRGLRLLAEETESAPVPGQLEKRLLEVFRERRAVQSVSLTDGGWRYWISAAAAVLVIVASGVAIRWHIARSMAQPQVAVDSGGKTDPGKSAGIRSPDAAARNLKHLACHLNPKKRPGDLVATARLIPAPQKTITHV